MSNDDEYYCKPRRSNHKGKCEKNHEHFRECVPKGKSMNTLTQKDINYVSDMVNNYPRKSLNFNSPIDIAALSLNKKVLSLNKLTHLNITQAVYKIPLNKNLKPASLSISFISFCPKTHIHHISGQSHIHFYPWANIVVAGESLNLDIFNFMPEQRQHINAMETTAIIITIYKLLNLAGKQLNIICL